MFTTLLETMIPPLYGALELIGVLIIFVGSIRALIAFILSRFNFEDEDVKIQLAQALALALEFKMAAEILKTVILHTVEELTVLSIIVILRVILTFVIHWEIKTSHEEKLKKARELEVSIKKVQHEQMQDNE